MCTGVEIAMLASAAVGTVGTIYSGMQQAAAADDQAQIAENNAAYEADANKQQAEKIRRMAKAQRGEANAALAASGVKLGEGTPLAIQKDIIQKSEEDALSAMLTGSRALKSGSDQADMLRASGNAAMVGSAVSVLATGANAYGNWKRIQPKAGAN
jgi:tRNA(Glu) U13 pseudouridine synthase TruD